MISLFKNYTAATDLIYDVALGLLNTHESLYFKDSLPPYFPDADLKSTMLSQYRILAYIKIA